MKPKIEDTHFGSITISGDRFDHDIIIELDGKIRKRKKKLSSNVYGTSHVMSLDEARDVFEEGARQLIVGTGQTGQLGLSSEAAEYFADHRCAVSLAPTPEAIEAWNATKGEAIGLFHVTC